MRRRNRIPGCGLLLALFVCAGCVSGPTAELIPAEVRVESTGTTARDVRSGVLPWWDYLDDKDLDGLIRAALVANPTPRIAAARLARAREDLTVARSGLIPAVQGRQSRDGVRFKEPETDTRSDLSALEVSWNPGGWGLRQLEMDLARQVGEALWFEQQDVELILSATIADTYFQIVELGGQRRLLQAQIEVSEDLEDLIEARFRLGQARANELYQQRAQTTVLRQLKVANDARAEVLEANLDVLLGEAPDDASRVRRQALPEEPTAIGTGSPDELIRHRADIRAAYARVQQAAAQVGIRIANRLPALRVTTNLASLTDRTLSTGVIGYVLDLSMPLFTGARLEGLERQARFAFEEARQRYLQVWLAALEEVNTLDIRFRRQKEIIATLTARRGHARQALDAARNRYILGDQNYLDVLTALRALQEADRLLVAERRQLVSLSIFARQSAGQPMCLGNTDCTANWALEG